MRTFVRPVRLGSLTGRTTDNDMNSTIPTHHEPGVGPTDRARRTTPARVRNDVGQWIERSVGFVLDTVGWLWSPLGRIVGDRSAPCPLHIAVIDDPTGSLRIVAASGHLDHRSAVELAGELDQLDEGQALHLDASDLSVGDREPIEIVGRVLDDLELRGVPIRVVGIHPL